MTRSVRTWGNCHLKHMELLFRLQKRAVRLCSGSHYLAHTDPIFKHFRLLKVLDINILQTAVFMFKLKQNLLPTYFNSMFTCNRQVHSYNTRISHNFHLRNPKTTLSSRSIRHKGPDIWHSLSSEVKQCTLLSSFKKKLKNHLITLYE